MTTNFIKSTLLSAIATLLCLAANAQTPEWAWAIDSNGAQGEQVRNIAAAANGDVYAIGSFSDPFSIGDTEITVTHERASYQYLCKFSALGELLWFVTLNDSDVGYGMGLLRGLVVDSYDNAYFTSAIIRPDTLFGDFTANIAGVDFSVPDTVGRVNYIAKVDPDGNGVWVQGIATQPSTSTGGISFALVMDTDGHLYVQGDLRPDISVGGTLYIPTSFWDIFLARLDASGNVEWIKIIRNGTYSRLPQCSAASGGGVLINSVWYGGDTLHVGDMYLVKPNPLIFAFPDRWIAKIGPDGTTDWLVREGGEGWESPGAITSTPAGGAMVYSAIEDDSPITLNGETYFPKGYLLTRYSNSGVLEHVAHYPTPTEPLGLGAQKIHSDGNDTYFMSLNFKGYEYNFGDWQFANAGGFSETSDILISAVDIDGTPLWATSIGGSEDDFQLGLAFNQNVGLLICGNFQSNVVNIGANTLENVGFLTTDFFLAALDFTSSVTSAPDVQPLHLYPNPGENHVNVDLSSLRAQQHTLRIFDTRGSLVLSQNVMGGNVEKLEISNLPRGNYVVLIHVDGVVHASKFIKL